MVCQETLEEQYTVVANNLDALLHSSKDIGDGPITSSISNVCCGEGFLPHLILYPVDKIISAIDAMGSEEFVISEMPWYEKPSAGYEYYFLRSRFWVLRDFSENYAQGDNEHPIMLFRLRRVLPGGPWSFVFWGHERLVQVGVVSGRTVENKST